MSKRLVTILSGLLIFTSAALSVLRARTAESGEEWSPAASVESELPGAAWGIGPLASPSEETLEKLFNHPPAASGPPHPATASATEPEEPWREPAEPALTGREVGYLRLAGGKAMIFVRRR